MASNDELNVKFLEHAMEAHSGANRTFLRDLKIVFVVLLVFQFALFFRFIDLNDRRVAIDDQLDRLREERAAFGQVGGGVTALEEAIQLVRARLDAAPDELRLPITRLEDYIDRLRAPDPASPECTALPGSCPSPQNPMAQSPIQTAQTPNQGDGLDFAQGLTDHEIQVLTTASPPEEYDGLVKRIVNERIVPPIFTALNDEKDRVMGQGFADAKAAFLSTLEKHKATVAARGLRIADIEGAVNKAETDLRELRFAPPPTDTWWQTVGGKETAAVGLLAAVDQFGKKLDPEKAKIDTALDQVTGIIGEKSKTRTDLAKQQDRLQEEFAAVRESVQDFTKPLPLIPLQLKDAVLYYPVVASAVIAFLVGRYLLLRRNAGSLAVIARRFGVDDDVLGAYLGEGTTHGGHHGRQRTGPSRVLAGALVSALCLIPIVLVAASLYQTVTSPGLKSDREWVLYASYVVAGVAAVAAFGLLVVAQVRTGSAQGGDEGPPAHVARRAPPRSAEADTQPT